MKHDINLNEKTGTYSNCISENIQTIYGLYESADVTVDQFRNEILKITETAKDTSAKRGFILNMNRKRTKDDILMYVSNVTMSAQHLGASPDYRWTNEKH